MKMKKALKIFSLCMMLFALTFTTVATFSATTTNVEAATSGWRRDGRGWWYQNANGSYPRSQWMLVSNRWYYFNGTGYMVTGWLKLGNTWYYLDGSGAMITGWLRAGNTWYYLNNSGAMVTGWLKTGNTWYYLNSSGAMATGWLKAGNTWYHLEGSGAMSSNKWIRSGSKDYYLEASGAMATNKWIGQWYVGSDGAWIPNHNAQHRHSWSSTKTQAATCTTAGKTYQTCTTCNAENQLSTLPAKGHTAGAWNTTKEATCTATGTRVQTCTVDNFVMKTETIAARGHSLQAWVTTKQPTLHTTGERTQKCSTCNNIINRQVIPVLNNSKQIIDLGNGQTQAVDGRFDYGAANRIIDLVNAERAKVGLPALTVNNTLMDVAQTRAPETNILFDHKRPNGLPWHSLSTFANGENIAYATGNADKVMELWMNSDGHRANILRSSFRSIGVACFQGKASNGTTYNYYVQIFGNSH